MTSSSKSPSPSKPNFRAAIRRNVSPTLVDHHGVGLNKPGVIDSTLSKGGLTKPDQLGEVSPDLSSILVAQLMLIWSLPFLHLLDLANAKFSKASLGLTVQSLKALFRRCSILVTAFSNGDSSTTAFARCLTMEQVEFVVMFWEVEKDMYCIELQRVSGDKQTFWEHARRIIDIVLGRQTNLPPDDPLCFDLAGAESNDKIYHGLGKRTLGKEILCSSEEMTAAVVSLIKFLEKGHHDRDSIVLESLEAMLDPNMSGFEPARVVAKMVLDPNDALFSRLVELIPNLDDPLFPHHAHMALRVLAKSIGLVGKAERERVSMTNPQLMEWLQAVANRGNPHVAYCAVHILSYFVRDNLVQNFEMEPHMKHLGSTSHAALEKACWRLSNAVTTKSMN